MPAFPLKSSLMAAAVTAMLAICMNAGAQNATDLWQSGSGRAVNFTKDRAAQRVVSYVYQSQFSYVRIETREPGAALNEHPLNLDSAALRAALASVMLDDSTKTQALGDDELAELLPPLAKALARATPEQEVSFAIAGRYGFSGPMALRSITTARVFRRDGRLQVIFGLLRVPFESQLRATGYLRPFDPGQRSEPVDRSTRVQVVSGLGQAVRPDWVALDLGAASAQARAAAAAASSAAAESAPAAAGFAPAPPAAPATPASSAVSALPAAVPAALSPAALSPTATDGDAIAARAAERLKALKKLRDQGLISEQEYQDKRTQILRDL